jgi:hypothetical protein
MVTTARVATGTVRGRVIDESGTVVPDVRVAVDNRTTSADVWNTTRREQ